VVKGAGVTLSACGGFNLTSLQVKIISLYPTFRNIRFGDLILGGQRGL